MDGERYTDLEITARRVEKEKACLSLSSETDEDDEAKALLIFCLEKREDDKAGFAQIMMQA
jgi:hypothetical protein